MTTTTTPPPPGTDDKPKRKPVLDRIQQVDTMPNLDKGKMLITGPSGAGKSTMGARMPGRVLIGLSEQQAVPSIKRANPKAKVLSIESFDDLIDFAALVASPSLGDHFDSVVLDSLTDVQQIVKRHLTRQQEKRQDVTDQDTWGVVIDKTASLVRTIRDARAHVLIICGDDEDNVAGVGLTHRPAVQGKKLPGKLSSYVQAQGYVHVQELANGNKRRTVHFLAGERYLTKIAGDLATAEPPEPTHIINQIIGGTLAVPDDVQQRIAEWHALAATAAA